MKFCLFENCRATRASCDRKSLTVKTYGYDHNLGFLICHITRVLNLCDKSCEFLFTNWLRPTYASQKNAICDQNSPNMSQTVRSLVLTHAAVAVAGAVLASAKNWLSSSSAASFQQLTDFGCCWVTNPWMDGGGRAGFAKLFQGCQNRILSSNASHSVDFYLGFHSSLGISFLVASGWSSGHPSHFARQTPSSPSRPQTDRLTAEALIARKRVAVTPEL